MRLLNSIAVACIFCSAFLNSGHAQEVADKKPTKVIESFHVKTDVRFRFATTQMVSVVRNTADHAQEIDFTVTLPKEAFISSFFMFIDGNIYHGEVKEQEKAKRQYQKAVRRGSSAGLIRQKPRHANIFEVSVNIANGSAVNFTLTYQQVLKRKLGVYDLEIHVDPGMPVEDFSIEVYIRENADLKFVRTPALREETLLTNEVEASNELTLIEQPTPKSARILYKPSLEEQGEEGISARFAVQYDVDHSKKGEILMANGYFIHMFAPDLPAMPKDIVFTLDVSGSMSGSKMSQLKKAMAAILKDLKPEDKFNIHTFSTSVGQWRDNLVPASSGNIVEATRFVESMIASGSTNINAALLKGLDDLSQVRSQKRAPLIFFLTDGLPTKGVRVTSKIVQNVLQKNQDAITIISLAFGSGADYSMLKTISAQNAGFARKIYEASDSSLQVSSLYKEISAVVLRNVTFTYLPGVAQTKAPTPRVIPTIFDGGEIIICDPLAVEAMPSAVVKMTAYDVTGPIEIDLDIEDVEIVDIDLSDADDEIDSFFKREKDYTGIIEKMWAFLTIKKLLKEKEKEANNEDKLKELNGKILEMSLKYKFVTPSTSMVVTKPEDDEMPQRLNFGEADSVSTSMRLQSSHYRVAQSVNVQRAKAGPFGLGLSQQYAPSASQTHHQQQIVRMMPVNLYTSANIRQATVATITPMTTVPTTTPMTTVPTTTPMATVPTTTPMTTVETTTPTTTRPTTVPSPKKHKKKNRRRPSFKTLRIIVVETPSYSVCLTTRRIQSAVYHLFENSQNVTVTLSTSCLKNCRLVVPISLSLTVNSIPTTLLLNSNGVWNVSGVGLATVTFQGPSISMTYGNTEVEVSKTIGGRKEFYSVKVVQKDDTPVMGVIDAVKSFPRKKMLKIAKRKAPKVCTHFNTSISFHAKNRLMSQFTR